jgi:hypothetical protein
MASYQALVFRPALSVRALKWAVLHFAGLPTGPTYHGGGSAYAEWRTAEISDVETRENSTN